MHGLAYAARLASAGLEGHSRPETLNLTAWIHALGLNTTIDCNRVQEIATAMLSLFAALDLSLSANLSTVAASIDL